VVDLRLMAINTPSKQLYVSCKRAKVYIFNLQILVFL
jgi:hypothetical protein